MNGNWKNRFALAVATFGFATSAWAGGIWCATYSDSAAVHEALVNGDLKPAVVHAAELAEVLSNALDNDQVPKEYLNAVKNLRKAATLLSVTGNLKEARYAFVYFSQSLVSFIRADKATDQYTLWYSPAVDATWVQSVKEVTPRNPFTGEVGKGAGYALSWKKKK